MRNVVVIVGLAGCAFTINPGAGDDAPVIDAPEIDATDAPVCTTSPGGPCPTNYVFVPQNCAYDAGEFCIAKYEMKNLVNVAMSEPGGTPWGNITTAQARAACAANGSRYHLVTNDEWMATARAIEATPANWSTTAIPFLSKGKTDRCGGGCPGPDYCPSAAAADNAPCTGTSITNCGMRGDPDFRFNRTHQVLAGGVIWDFSGNMFELIDHPPTVNPTEGMHPGLPINSSVGTSFLPPLADADYKSANLAHRDVTPWPSVAPTENVGILYVTATTAQNVTRGGDFCGFAGIYSVSLLVDSELGINVGFRCAYK